MEVFLAERENKSRKRGRHGAMNRNRLHEPDPQINLSPFSICVNLRKLRMNIFIHRLRRFTQMKKSSTYICTICGKVKAGA
jgi:hypothetical protein